MPWYSLNGRMCGAQSWYGSVGERYLLLLLAIEAHIVKPIA
jgi:hypothetical protein